MGFTGFIVSIGFTGFSIGLLSLFLGSRGLL